MAKEYLTNNHSNRKVKERVATGYRKDMEEGRWEMTGEPIQFAKSGALLNGQHRLLALSWSKIKHLDMFVVRGLPESSQLLMDQGTSRTIADMLKLEGGEAIKNVTVCAAIARWLTLAPVPGVDFGDNLKRKCAAGAALATYREHSDLISMAADRAVSIRNANAFPMSVSALGYCYYHFANLEVQAAYNYFYAFTDLAFNDIGDPRKAAYMRLGRMMADEEMKHGHMLTVATVSVLTRSWNQWRNGEEIDTILARGRDGWIPPVKPI
jgi:hypothetical protein